MKCNVVVLDSVQSTVYSQQSTMYSVHCTLYSERRTLYCVQCIQCTLYSVHCTVYTVQLGSKPHRLSQPKPHLDCGCREYNVMRQWLQWYSTVQYRSVELINGTVQVYSMYKVMRQLLQYYGKVVQYDETVGAVQSQV